MKLIFLLIAGIGLAAAQVPGFGGCPEFDSQPDFDMNKFLGTWYESERYVNIFEAGTRCVKTNYTKAVDGRFLVANEIMNRFTSVKRVLEGEIRLIVKGSESKLNIKYPNLPIPYESQLMVLDTDYDSYAVMWSCSSLGIINTQNAWILTREKLAPGTVLQKAYGVLDKYKLSRTFFVKTDQNSCEIAEAADSSHTEHTHSAAPASATPAPSSNTGSRKPVKKTVQKVKTQPGPISATSAPTAVPAAAPAVTVPAAAVPVPAAAVPAAIVPGAAVPAPASPAAVSAGRDEVAVKPEAAAEVKPHNEGQVVSEQKVVAPTSTA
ncbi:hypothetical protein V9T40_007045 [Parthenolecanium corni]|uniref:Lipocalin/cytosolic fatty-acid binding domain-containing protein n=1 Tax=Parthenolecanium corni TaxID=536013 RepID=A0AAN9TWT7_9HEMI